MRMQFANRDAVKTSWLREFCELAACKTLASRQDETSPQRITTAHGVVRRTLVARYEGLETRKPDAAIAN